MKRIYIIYLVIMLFIITSCVMVLRDQAKITFDRDINTNVDKDIIGIIVDKQIILDTIDEE